MMSTKVSFPLMNFHFIAYFRVVVRFNGRNKSVCKNYLENVLNNKRKHNNTQNSMHHQVFSHLFVQRTFHQFLTFQLSISKLMCLGERNKTK